MRFESIAIDAGGRPDAGNSVRHGSVFNHPAHPGAI